MKSDKEVLEYPLDHLELMKRPHLWPAWPALPVKRWHEDTHTMDNAVLLEDEGDHVLFYLNAHLFSSPGTWGVPTLRTPEEITAEGWVVD